MNTKENTVILYVEDEEGIRNGMSKTLGYFCDELLIATDGLEGLKAFKEHRPHLVISDIKMPNMSGIEMVRAIKEINPEQYVIFTTAHSESSYFMEAINLQVDGYILKPVDLGKLEAKINSIKELIKLKKDFSTQQVITNEIATLQDNMLVVLNESNKPIFLNDKFLNYLLIEKVEQFTDKYDCLSDIFLEASFSNLSKSNLWLEEIENISDEKRIVSMIDFKTSLPKTFLISSFRLLF